MTRNLDSRVEAVAPVEDPDIRRQLKFVLELMLSDNRKRWTMNADGSYDQQYPGDGEPVVNTQGILMREALKASRNEDVTTGIPRDYPVDRDLLVDAVDGVPETADTSAADGGHETLTRHADRWYHPESDTYDYAVRTPDGDRRYFKTETGAREALERLYD
jgi:polyphosphate kinase